MNKPLYITILLIPVIGLSYALWLSRPQDLDKMTYITLPDLFYTFFGIWQGVSMIIIFHFLV